MKKITIYLAVISALCFIGFVSILIGAEPVKLELKTKQVSPKTIEKKTPVLKKQTLKLSSRLQFGEPNDNSSSARLLKGFGRSVRFAAGFSNSNDVDFYKVKAVTRGFGTWFKIDITSVAPQNFNLFVELYDPAGKVIASEYVTNGSFWVALKSNVETKIKITPGDSWGTNYVYYNIGLTKGYIIDLQENDDTKSAATLITHGISKKAYMCGVLDSSGKTVGLSDWFKYNHNSCRNDCVSVSKSASLEFCGSPIVDDCSGCSNEGTRICLSEGCEGDGWGTSSGIRYIHVRPIEEPNPYGQGEVPDVYKTPYTIQLIDSGHASFDDDCNP